MKLPEMICGYPASVVKDVLRVMQSSHYLVNSDYLHDTGLSVAEAQALILALFNEGYLEIDTHDIFGAAVAEAEFPQSLVISDKARRILNAKAGHRMKRATIEKLLDTVLERAAETKHARFLRYEPEYIWVYGSYLQEQDDYGDLDLAVRFLPKMSFEGDEGLTDEQKADDLLGMDPLDHYRALIENVERRFLLAWQLNQEKKTTFKPVRPHMYTEPYWDLSARSDYLKQKNYRISLETIKTLKQMKLNAVLLVYDVHNGGKITPRTVNPNDY